MNVKILKKINQRCRIITLRDGMFHLQNKVNNKWHTINTFSSIKKALQKKHIHVIMIILRDLGYRNKFINKRIKRNKNKLQK